MWNLFSTVEPKVIKPSRSLKQQLLIQQKQNLQEIQQQAKNILNTINTTLKSLSTGILSDQEKDSFKSLELELQCNLTFLQKRLEMENLRFNESITNRDQQKQNHQQFFKATMKSYENKKSQLNKYIKDLEEKVQKLQMLGLKTYSLNPDQDHVLNGFNQKLIEKYLSKLSLIKNVQHDMEDIFKNNNKNIQRLNSTCSSKTFSSQKSQNISLFESINLCQSFQSLEKHLQTILINQQIIGSMLNNRLKKREKQFQKLASQQKALKLGLNKLQQQSDKRNQPYKKLVVSNEKKNQTQRPQSPKETKLKSRQSQQVKENKLDVSFSDSIEQKIEQEEKDNQNQSNKKETLQQEQQIPSVNFLNACQDLITKTFLQGQENQ